MRQDMVDESGVELVLLGPQLESFAQVTAAGRKRRFRDELIK